MKHLPGVPFETNAPFLVWQEGQPSRSKGEPKPHQVDPPQEGSSARNPFKRLFGGTNYFDQPGESWKISFISFLCLAGAASQDSSVLERKWGDQGLIGFEKEHVCEQK